MSLAPKRRSGPLGKLQTEADALKIKIDEVTGITNKWSPRSADDPQVISCHRSCIDYKIEASSLLLKANNLQMHDEPNTVSNFEQKKSDEIKRLLSLQTRLDRMIDGMEELENGNDLRNTRTKELGKIEDVTDDKDIESEEEEEEDDYDDDEDDESEEADFYIAIHEFKAEQEGDLPLQMDEVVDVILKRDDGWWEAENEDGKRGLVPSNFLQEYDEEEEEEESTPAPKVEESVKAEEPQTDTSPQATKSPRTGKQLWQGIKDAVGEPHKTDVTDVLAAMGALPAGFRPSMLYNLVNKGPEHSLRSAILPVLTDSNLSFRDMHWDPAINQLRKVVTHTLRSCKIWKCVMIPLPGTGVEILSHHIRYALFNGTKVISNIQTLQAQVSATKPKMWQFSSASSKVGGILPSLKDGHSIVRTDSNHSNLGILFELALTYIRNPPRKLVRFSDGLACDYGDDDEGTREKLRQTGERGELSCGWAHLKLFDEQGNPIPNKTYELTINGGTPYEQGIAVDPSINRRATTSKFRALLAANKQPKLMVQIGTPSNLKRKYLDLLPSTVVLPASYCELVSLYRRLLVDALVCERLAISDASLAHCPSIAAFLDAIDQSDIMDAIRINWQEKSRLLSRADKRDKEHVKDVFKSVVMETAYPLLHLTTLPNSEWANEQTSLARLQHIHQTVTSMKQQDGVLNHFLSSAHEIEPFDISELTFDPLRNYGRSLL